jgi:RNA ligase (TIGR02306 family)
MEPGTDISDIRNVKKYVKQLPANLAGIALGSFPTAIVPKTDEPNFQMTESMIDQLQGQAYYSTVKCDGSSGTIYKDYFGIDYHFGCCSRNLEFRPSMTTAIWKIAIDYDLENALPVGYAIQLEMCGPGIQKNRLGLDKIEPRVFNVWDIKDRKYLDAVDMFAFCKDLNIPTVEVIVWDEVFDIKDSDILRKMAEGKYSSGQQREGIVIRPMKDQFCEGERLSFKVINLLFKD